MRKKFISASEFSKFHKITPAIHMFFDASPNWKSGYSRGEFVNIKILSPTGKEEHLVRDTRREYAVRRFNKNITYGSLTLVIDLSRSGRGRYKIEEKCKHGYEGAYAKCLSAVLGKRLIEKREKDFEHKIINENNISVALRKLVGIPETKLYIYERRSHIVTPKIDDYYTNTNCTFKPVIIGDYTEVDKVWNNLKLEPRFKHHKSPCRRSISEYLVDYQNGDIYRYSNHWGRCASCVWDLETDETIYDLSIGVANLKDFQREEVYYVRTKSEEAATKLMYCLENNITKINSILNDTAAKITEKSRKILQSIIESSHRIIEHLNKKHYRICEELCKSYIEEIYSNSLKC